MDVDGFNVICPYCKKKAELSNLIEDNDNIYYYLRCCDKLMIMQEINGKAYIQKIKKVIFPPLDYYYSDVPVNKEIIHKLIKNNEETQLPIIIDNIEIKSKERTFEEAYTCDYTDNFNISLDCNSYNVYEPEFPYPEGVNIYTDLDIPVLLENNYCYIIHQD